MICSEKFRTTHNSEGELLCKLVCLDAEPDPHTVWLIEERHSPMYALRNKACNSTNGCDNDTTSTASPRQCVTCCEIGRKSVGMLQQLFCCNGDEISERLYGFQGSAKVMKTDEITVGVEIRQRYPLNALISYVLLVGMITLCSQPTLVLEARRRGQYYVTRSTPLFFE